MVKVADALNYKLKVDALKYLADEPFKGANVIVHEHCQGDDGTSV
jgi:hypothetical protein